MARHGIGVAPGRSPGGIASSLAYLAIGLSAVNLPLKGGTLVPAFGPPNPLIMLFTDAGGPLGWTASNGLHQITP